MPGSGGEVGVADRHRLTAYDAAYLELAVRHRAALASLDQALCRAAVYEGITVLEANGA